MANQGADASGHSQQQTTAHISIHVHNGTQVAGRISQGQSHLISRETQNSTSIGINNTVEEDADDVVNNTETVVVPRTPTLKKPNEMDSGCERGEGINSITQTDNLTQLKRPHAEDRYLNFSAVKRRCSNIILEELVRLVSTEHLTTSGIHRQSDADPVRSYLFPKQSKVQSARARQYASDEALPGTSDHLSIRHSNALAGGGGDISIEEKPTSSNKNNNNENGYERTAHVASFPAMDPILKEAVPTASHSTESEYLKQLKHFDDSEEWQRSRRNELIEADGRVSDDIADPPGQQSLYIPPGDVRRESYRLSTFEHFPVTCSISRKSLAKSGFFFTGFYDRVKCFACARTVERWEETDNPAELKWHKQNCPFPKGQECGNVSLPNLFQAITPVLAAGLPSSASQSASQTNNQGEQFLEQRDPNTGAIIRRVRYPADLPERIRQTGGTFEIGPNNEVIIQSGPGPGQQNPANVGLQATQQQPRRQWRMANVILADHKRFLTNLYLNRELDRLASFARWPTGRPNIAPAYLAKTGFFYLGDMDRTQCFSCGGVLRNWNLEDDAEAEHRTHFPQCRMVVNTEPRNIPVHENPETEEEKARKYPCRFPANPHMRSENARLETFDRRWPMGKTAATPAEIAQGGFFFLGDRDRAKCWYCNGGLQNWEYDDIPWIEHAKWFPNCQFLLKVKGQHFVYRHLALNPHLARPIIARQDGSPLESVGAQPTATPGGQPRAQRSHDIPPSEPRVNQPSATPAIIDPQAEMRKRKERVQNIMRNSDLVKNVLAMGFDDKIVSSLLEDRIISGNETNPDDVYESASQLLEDVFKKEEEIKKVEEERRNQISGAVATPLPSLPGPGSFGIASSMYSGPLSQPSLGPAPRSGKYNVSYFGDDDDEEIGQDMYGSLEGSSTSVTNVTAAKRLLGAEENRESLQEALNKIEEERMCKICFTN